MRALVVFAAGCLLSVTPRLGVASPGGEPGEAPDASRRVSLSISGGVSLGGYEAGALWSWLSYYRARADGALPDAMGGDRRDALVGITGASAGGINSLIAALMWCSADAPLDVAGAPRTLLGTVDDNLIARAWADVGFDTLLPPDAEPDDFYPLDGLLTRHAFAPAVGLLQAAFDAPVYRPGCRIPLTVTVTRGRPWRDEVAGLTVVNQRFALPLLLTVDATGRAWFVNHTEALRNERQLGQYLMLAERPGVDEQRLRGRDGGEPPPWVVPADLVLQAVLASSAFPLAFSPVVLLQCVPADDCPPEVPSPPLSGFDWLGCAGQPGCGDFGALTCAGLSTPARPLERCASRFVDGGVFDNVPLGPAMAQAELGLGPDEVAVGVDYLYFDPDVRRLAQETSAGPDDAGDRGMSRVLAVLGDAVGTARAYELYTTLRYGTLNTSPATIVEGFAALYADAKGLVGAPTGAAFDGPLDRCLAAVAADDTDGCPPLPPACAVERFAAASAPSEPGPVDAAEACLPRDVDATVAGLSALGRRLSCRVWSADFGAVEGAAQRTLAAAAIERVERVDACLDGLIADAHARLLVARLDRDLADARAFVIAADEGAEPARRLVLPTRFPPLAAGQLRNFGAFFDGPLRRYDYFAGVYDGLRNVALWRCDERLSARAMRDGPRARARCVDGEFAALRAALMPDAAPLGATLLDELQIQERVVASATARPPMPDPCAGGRCAPPTDCAFDDPLDRGACRAHAALSRCTGAERKVFDRDGAPFCAGDLGIEGFVDALDAVGYRPRSHYMRLLLDGGGAAGPLLAIIARLGAIEDAEAQGAARRAERDRATAASHAVGAAAAGRNAFLFAGLGVGLRRIERVHGGVDLDPSTAPDGSSWASLLPFRLGVDTLHGGFAVGYEPRLNGGGLVEGRLIIDALRWRDGDNRLRSALNPAIALRAWDSLAVGALGVGPVVERPWSTAGWDVGALAHLDLVADTLRVGVGWLGRRVPDRDGASREPAVRWTVDVWVLDVPGVVWLLTR